MLNREAKIDSENCIPSGYHSTVATDVVALLRLGPKPCNLSTCRHAYADEAIGLSLAGLNGTACWSISSSSSARKRVTARHLTKSCWPIGSGFWVRSLV